MNTLRIIMLVLLGYLMPTGPLYAQQHPDTSGLAAEMAVIYKLYTGKQYAFDIRYTFSAAQNPDRTLDSLSGRLEATDSNYLYRLGQTTSLTNGRYNIVLQTAMKKMYLSKPVAGEQLLRKASAGFQPAAVKSWAVSSKGNLRVLHIDFLPGLPFVSADITRDMVTGYLASMRYVVPARYLQRFGWSNSEEELAAFGDYAVVMVSYILDKKYKPDMTVFKEESYFRKAGTTFTPTSAFSDYQVIIASPNL